MPIVNIILPILLILFGVAFIILIERKIVRYIQNQKGPNKVGLIIIIQPFSDAIKLFFKEQTLPLISNYIIYIISPVIGLFSALLIWSIFPFLINCISFNLGILFIYFLLLYEYKCI